jgi:hypothetical protein
MVTGLVCQAATIGVSGWLLSRGRVASASVPAPPSASSPAPPPR